MAALTQSSWDGRRPLNFDWDILLLFRFLCKFFFETYRLYVQKLTKLNSFFASKNSKFIDYERTLMCVMPIKAIIIHCLLFYTKDVPKACWFDCFCLQFNVYLPKSGKGEEVSLLFLLCFSLRSFYILTRVKREKLSTQNIVWKWLGHPPPELPN